mgnify:CR=1 FL=1
MTYTTSIEKQLEVIQPKKTLRNILPLSPSSIDHLQYSDHGNSGIQIEIPRLSKIPH